jgi:hypothetical protein
MGDRRVQEKKRYNGPRTRQVNHQITIERRMRKNFTTRFVRKVANERKLGVLTKDYGKVYHKDK